MEYIKINDKKYEYAVDFKNNKEQRRAFNLLTKETYGFDFEEWYGNGYWKDKYIPHTLMDGEKAVSNVSVNIMDFLVMGEKKRYIQIGTVMTDKDYRNMGLSKFLMEKVLTEWSNKVDLIYLFANNSVLNFYPKFAFNSVQEYQYSKKIVVENTNSSIKKLNMDNKRDIDFLVNRIKKALPISNLHMYNNESLIMFYCISFMKENVYYIESLDTIIIVEFSDDILYLNHIFSISNIPLNDIIKAVGNKKLKEVVLGFTPLDINLDGVNYDVSLLRKEENTLFIMGKDADIFRDKHLMFPVLSHA